MSIKMQSLIKEEEDRAAGFYWTSESDPTWLRYQVDLQTGAMKGFHISQCNGQIPNVTPFLYNFPSVHLARTYHTQVALAVFADIGKEMLIRNGEATIGSRAGSTVSSWQDFMGAFGNDKGVVLDDHPEERTLTYEADMMIPSGIVKSGKSGALSMPRNRNFKVGSRLSGFKAVEVARTKGLPRGLNVATIGDPDLEKAAVALKAVERPSSHAVNWYGTRDKTLSNVRAQSASALPILAGLIADRQSLAKAVDEMGQLHTALMTATGLSKAGLKRIGKLTKAAPAGRIFEAGERIEGEDALGVNRARHTDVSGSLPTDMALRYLSELPPDRTPQSDEEWLRFNDILTAIAIPLHNATSIPVIEILEASKGNWVAFHESLAKAADFPAADFDRRTMALVNIDALEAIDHFNRTAVLPQALASIRATEQPDPLICREFIVSSQEASRNLIIGKTKNPALLMMEISRKYASRIPAMMELEGKSIATNTIERAGRFAAYGEGEYPKSADDFTSSKGFIIRCLDSGEKLTEESRRLTHCVGGYQSRAKMLSTHLFSVQNIAGDKSFSTFELQQITGDDSRVAAAGMRAIQHRAKNNGNPSEDCVAARQEFIDALTAGTIAFNLEEMNAWREYLNEIGENPTIKHVTPTTTWRSIIELDWEDEDLRMNYWAEWGQVLGGRIAKSPHPGAIYAEPAAQQLVAAMSPRAAAIMIEQSRAARETKAEPVEGVEP